MEEDTGEPATKKTSLKSYTSKVLTESSLSALSNILSTRSTRRKGFKTIVFLFCLTGFFYQSGVFLGYVFEFPTIVDVDITSVENAEMPGITFCNNNGIVRSKFCRKYPNFCKEADKKYCTTYPSHCTENKTLVPKKEYYKWVNNMTLEEYYDLGPDSGSLLKKIEADLLSTNPTIEDVEGPFLRAKTITGEGRIGCYSLFSLVNSSDLPQETLETKIFKFPIVTLKFNVEENEVFIPIHTTGLIFSIHSPFMAANPVENGIFMRPGRVYKIHFKMEKEVLLPYPFDTNCHNYTDDWLKNNKTGFRLQEMCRHECAYKNMMKYLNCSILSVLYPNSAKICPNEYSKGSPSEEVIDEEMDLCNSECREDCSKVKYSYSVQESFTADTIFEDWNEEEKKLIVVEIYFGDSEIVTMKHRPQYLSVEVFSYIGGFIGVWLGISLVEITNFLESLFRIAIFAFKRKSNK